MKLEYPSKIILAWGEAISGNSEIREWLIANGYPELGLFAFALRNIQSAREWLMKNNFPQLMALINGAEGNPNALLWLKKHDFTVLLKMAEAADNNEKSLTWLIQNNLQHWAVIARKIQVVKNQIELDNNDVHKISSN